RAPRWRQARSRAQLRGFCPSKGVGCSCLSVRSRLPPVERRLLAPAVASRDEQERIGAQLGRGGDRRLSVGLIRRNPGPPFAFLTPRLKCLLRGGRRKAWPDIATSRLRK